MCDATKIMFETDLYFRIPKASNLKGKITNVNGQKSSKFIENKCTHCVMQLVLIEECAYCTGNI